MNTELLESTGYSWSGVADVIRSSPLDAGALLHQIDAKCQNYCQHEEALEKELREVQFIRSLCVSCFVYAHKALGLGDEQPLVFERDSNVIVVKILDYEAKRIDYESRPITALEARAS